MVETRQTYSQPEISFNYLSKRGFGWSHLDVGGGGDGDDDGDDGGAGGLLDFCENKNPISYKLIIVLSNFSIQSRIGVVFHFEHSIRKIKS